MRQLKEKEEDMTMTPAPRPWVEPALTAAQQSELKAALEQDFRRLLARHSPLARLDARSGLGRGSAPDLATDATTADVVQELEPHGRRRAVQILDALRRIDAGTYGICVGCRSPISYERLSAIPETTLCVRCGGSSEWSRRP
jgi:DnaK suppressor protein